MFSRKKKILREIREAWGHPVDRIRNFDRIGMYHAFARSSMPDLTVTDATAEDLELNNVFAKVDRTISSPGSQYLHHLLRTIEPDDSVLDIRSKIYQRFSTDAPLRERIQLQLGELSSQSAYYLPNILFKDLPPKPSWYLLIYLLSALSFAAIIVTFLQPALFWIALVVITINLFLDHFYGDRFSRHFADLSNLSSLLRVAQSLTRLEEDNSLLPVQILREYSSLAASLNRKIGWLTIDKGKLDVLTGAVLEYLNQFCLLRLVAWMRAGDLIQQSQPQLRKIFEAVALLDVSIAIASFLQDARSTCTPVLNDAGRIRLDSMYHPLLGNPVPNSINLDKQSCLFTGSNMAGKTTFVKTIGVNILLARTLHFCFAAAADIPRVMVCSSIRHSDDIASHKSRYYREIETLLAFIKLSSQPWRFLFIIDEILSSTNTVERIASAAGVLEFLGKANITLVTTHDIELRDLLGDRYLMYHFAEQVSGNDHSFDYLLRPGTSSAHNAIKLLEQIGYPKEIIDRANAIAARSSRA